jgi:DNA-binding transcriptional MocR family regulator
MSTTLLSAVMALPKDALPSSPRHVLTALAWHCNERAVRRGDRRCWPSLNTLSRETSLDRTTCMRAIEFLERRRFIEVERRLRVGNRYRLTDPRTWPTGGTAQPGPGSTAQPETGRIPPPEKVRELLRSFTKQVAWRNQPGRMVRPEQELGNSKQEGTGRTEQQRTG